MDIIKSIEHEQLKNKIPELKVGNTIRVHQRIKEGNRERIQVFEGIIIKKQGSGVNESFTVRKISYGVGVEKTFLIHSPLVEKVELVRVGKARRARLFYLRDRVGKASKTKEMIGARIEDKEIIIKEDKAEVPEEAKVETEETPVVEEKVEKVEANKEVVEELKEEKVEKVEKVEEAPKAEATQEVKEEKKEEPVKEDSKPEEETKKEEKPVEDTKTEE